MATSKLPLDIPTLQSVQFVRKYMLSSDELLTEVDMTLDCSGMKCFLWKQFAYFSIFQ